MKRKDAIEYITSWLRYGFGLSGKAKEVLKTAVKSMAELEKESCKLKEEINTMKYKVCCPMCDNKKCVKGTDSCEAEQWAKSKTESEVRNERL